MKVSVQIGKQIRQYREDKKLSREKLAELASIHPDYLSKIERGQRAPSVERLLRIIKCLDIKNEDFFKVLDL